MLIVCEGTDAAGKATQTKLLAERLKGTRFSFPNYASETGKAILGNLKREWCATGLIKPEEEAALPPIGDKYWDQRVAADKTLNALVFQSLQTVNRIELLPAIYKAMERGPVIFDRYWQSAVVYGTLDGLDPEWLRTVQEAPMPKADVNILIDVPIEEGFKRRPERRDRYETNREFLEKVRDGYLDMWRSPQTSIRTQSGWYIVNGLGSIEEIHNRICAVLRDRFGRGDRHIEGSWTPVAGWYGEHDRQYPEDGDK